MITTGYILVAVIFVGALLMLWGLLIEGVRDQRRIEEAERPEGCVHVERWYEGGMFGGNPWVIYEAWEHAPKYPGWECVKLTIRPQTQTKSLARAFYVDADFAKLDATNHETVTA